MIWKEISSGDTIYNETQNSHNNHVMVFKVVEKQEKSIGKVVVVKRIMKFDKSNDKIFIFNEDKTYGYSPSDEEMRYAKLDKDEHFLKLGIKYSFEGNKIIFR